MLSRGLDEAEASRELYSIPLSSGWFDWDRIDEIERRELQEFFDGSSPARNSRVYKEYRDFIINKYREDCSRRVSFTEVRKSLIGDVESLRRVYDFLDRWGIINFGVSGGRGEGLDGGDQLGGDSVVVVEEGPPPGVQVVPAKKTGGGSNGRGGEEVDVKIGGGRKLPPLTSYTDVFGQWVPGKGAACVSCGEHSVHGQNESVEGTSLTCQKCLEKKESDQSTSEDRPKLNIQINGVNNAWSDTETLLLLEAVLKHGDDWDLIALHVRTRNKLECIARLIQLPFGDYMSVAAEGKSEDKNFSGNGPESSGLKVFQPACNELPNEPCSDCNQQENNTNEKADEKAEEDSQPSRPAKRSRVLSFDDATSSLMRQVALMSTVAGPYVASAAADAAIAAICNDMPCARAAFEIDENMPFASSAANNELNNGQKVEGDLEVHDQADSTGTAPEKNFTAMAFRIRAATATAFGAVAARAKLVAEQEDREIEHQMSIIIEMQLRKIKYKMKYFEELTSIMEKEYSLIQRQKEQTIEEWICILQQLLRAGIPRWRDWNFLRSLRMSIA